MIKTATNTIKKYDMLQNNDIVVVGISGGADSCALLHFLNTIKHEYNMLIYAIHINHGIRGIEAYEDSKFVQQFCKSININCKIVFCNVKAVSKSLKISEEDAGRKVRYEEFRKLADEINATKIAVAHNINDQAETFIMHICRGSGLKGISGIMPIRENIIRPFIECDRKKIEYYCKINNINYRTDSTNNLDIYTRNKVRLNVFPILNEINKNFINNISKTSKIINEENQYMQIITENEYKKCTVSKENQKIILNIEYIKNLHIVIARRILIMVLNDIEKNIKNISYTHIDSIINLLEKGTGKKINLPYSIICETQYQNLKIYKNLDEKIKQYEYILKLESKVYIKEINKYVYISLNKQKKYSNIPNICTKVFDYDKIKSDIFIRTRKAGDYIQIKNGRKKIKDVFIDCKIPIDKRDLFPILSTNEKIISLIYIRDSIDFYTNENTKNKIYFYIWEEE